jgi:hypothetical protein
MSIEADPRLIDGKTSLVARLPNEYYFAFLELKERGDIKSLNDGILQAISYWLRKEKGIRIKHQ